MSRFPDRVGHHLVQFSNGRHVVVEGFCYKVRSPDSGRHMVLKADQIQLASRTPGDIEHMEWLGLYRDRYASPEMEWHQRAHDLEESIKRAVHETRINRLGMQGPNPELARHSRNVSLLRLREAVLLLAHLEEPQ